MRNIKTSCFNMPHDLSLFLDKKLIMIELLSFRLLTGNRIPRKVLNKVSIKFQRIVLCQCHLLNLFFNQKDNLSSKLFDKSIGLCMTS